MKWKSLQQLEDEAQEKFEKYCQETKVPILFWIVIGMVVVGGIVYTIGYLNAGIQ